MAEAKNSKGKKASKIPDAGTEKLTQGSLMRVMDWAYEKALDPGVPGLESAYSLAEDYLEGEGDLVDKVNSLIRWQNAKCATSGFITGLGGILTLPVAVPANLSSVLFIQIRMIAAIAIMGGYDVKNDKVQTFVYTCLLGSAAENVFKTVGIDIGKKLTVTSIRRMSYEVIKKINQKVGFRLVTKFGEKGVINLGKAVPIIGGLISATIDAVATNTIGNLARDIFIKPEKANLSKKSITDKKKK